jgi:sirohydrochlorin ferrochelatase
LTELRARSGVLLAAQGERRGVGNNATVVALASRLAQRGVAAEIRFGFINGRPTIGEAADGFAASEILVYPMFMSDGHFTRTRLPKLLAEAQRRVPHRRIGILPALGLDPGLARLVADKVTAAARGRGLPDRAVSVALLAHGSASNAASRLATEALGRRIGALGRFAAISCAFLDEPPSLADCVRQLEGPIVVIALLIGDGLHGGEDVPALMRMLDGDVMFGGSVGAWPEIAGIVSAATRAGGGASSSQAQPICGIQA